MIFWRLNSLSMFVSSKDPNIIRTAQALQIQNIRELWRGSKSNAVRENILSSTKDNRSYRTPTGNPQEPVERCVKDMESVNYSESLLREQCNPIGS